MIKPKSFINELFEMKADKLYSFTKKDNKEIFMKIHSKTLPIL